MRELILVTGTGKSGTTIVSKAFFDAGAPMGDLAELSTFAGGGGNVRGVWEHQDAMDLNKAILHHNGIDWFETPKGPLATDGTLDARLARFVAARPGRFCIKDPRFVWTADVWARHVERVRLVCCFRSPLGFVKSAHRTMPQIFPDSEDPSSRGLRTWLELNRQLLKLASRYESVFFSFDDPPIDMVATLRNLLWYFGLEFNQSAFDGFFMDQERRFSNAAVLTKSRGLPVPFQELWEALRTASFSTLLTDSGLASEREAGELRRLRHKHDLRGDLQRSQLTRQQRDSRLAAQTAHTARDVADTTLWEASRRADGSGTAQVLTCPPEQRSYDLVVPCYNAPDLTRKCIESLLATTDPRHRILLLDDVSPDPNVAPMLRRYAERHAHVEYHLAPKNRGFPATCNWGMQLSKRDVVLINNDAEFTPGWLARMDRCLRSHARLAAISPMSNNATICSVPQLNGNNQLPEGKTLQEMAELLAQSASCAYPRVPTVVGFCMLMTREAIDRIGFFDESFGLGYGEEVDWCQRAWMAGFECALCDDAYVYHHGEAGQASAGRVKERQRANEQEVARRWPDYHDAVFEICLQDPLRGMRMRLFDRLVHDQEKPRLMQVVHAWDTPGGTELHTRDLVRAVRPDWNVSVFYPTNPWAYCDVGMREEEGAMVIRVANTLVRCQHAYRKAPAELRAPHMERLFAEALQAVHPEVVHFQHVLGFGSMALPAIARAFGAKVLMTLHDYFLLCPDWNLIGPSRSDCGSTDPLRCTRAEACLEPKRLSADGQPPLRLDEYLPERRRWVEQALEAAHVIVTPSEFAKAKFTQALGDDVGRRIVVVPHGTHPFEKRSEQLVQLAGKGNDKRQGKRKDKRKDRRKDKRKGRGKKPHRPAASTGNQGSNPRLAFLGNFDESKGAAVFMRAAELVRDEPVDLEIVGGIGKIEDIPDHVKCRGSYRREDLPELLSGVDAVVVPSMWHETYCFTIDEAFRLGIPVIAARAGAIAERVTEGETGLLFELGDGADLAAAIQRFVHDGDLRTRLRDGVRGVRLLDHAHNMQAYRTLYRRLRTKRPDPSEVTRTLMQRARNKRVGAGNDMQTEQRAKAG